MVQWTTPRHRLPCLIIGAALMAVGTFAAFHSVTATVEAVKGGRRVTFACGSAVSPRHYSEPEARATLGFQPVVLTASEVLNTQCDPIGRRARSGMVAPAGIVLIVAAAWLRRWWTSAAIALAVLLLIYGVPHLFDAR